MFEIKYNCSYFSCYLLPKLSEIIVENKSITLFRVTTVNADIFYPIFTQTITILVCFIREKKSKTVQEICTHTFTKALTWTPCGAYSLPQTLSFNCFWLFQELMHPYFFCIIPWPYVIFMESSNSTWNCWLLKDRSYYGFCVFV